MIVLLITAFIIGWLVGAKQEQKRILNPKGYTPEPEVVEKLQTLAGIKEHDTQKGVEILMNAPAAELFIKQNKVNIETKSDNDKKQ